MDGRENEVTHEVKFTPTPPFSIRISYYNDDQYLTQTKQLWATFYFG